MIIAIISLIILSVNLKEIGTTILDNRWNEKVSNIEDFTQKIISTCVNSEQYDISVVFTDEFVTQQKKTKLLDKLIKD